MPIVDPFKSNQSSAGIVDPFKVQDSSPSPVGIPQTDTRGPLPTSFKTSGTQKDVMGIASPEGTANAEKAKDWFNSPTPEATSMTDFATRVVPSSGIKMAVGLPAAAISAGKGVVEGTINDGVTGAAKGVWDSAKGVAGFVGEKTGILPPGQVAEGDAPIDYGVGLPDSAGQWAQRVGHQVISDPVGVGMGLEGVKGGVKAVKEVPGIASDVAKGAGKVVDAIKPKPDVDALITEKYEKAVRPTVVGKRTSNQVESSANNVQRGVKKIVELKDNGKIKLGEDGESRPPQSLKEFADAITQAKEQVFSQYDGMAREANAQGATVDLSPIVNELTSIANDKVLQTTKPDAAKYAADAAQRFQETGSFTAEEAQQAIKSMNTSLEAFYRTPTYDTAVKAYTDSLIANHLRSGLDSVIESTVEPGYQGLKKDYGALKSMEKEVNHRSIVDARKNVKGLLDFSDIFSGAEALKGLLTMDPASFATGVAARGIKNWYKRLNDPNVQIKNMFERVDKHWDRGIEKPGFGEGVGTGIPEPGPDGPPASPEAYDPSQRIPGATTPVLEGNATPATPPGYGEVELRPGATGETPPIESVGGPDSRARQIMTAGLPEPPKIPPAGLPPGGVAEPISSIQEPAGGQRPGSTTYTADAYLAQKGIDANHPAYPEAKKMADDFHAHYGGIDKGKMGELDSHVDTLVNEAARPQKMYQATLEHLEQQTAVAKHKSNGNFSSTTDFQSALKEGYPTLRTLYESEHFAPGDVKQALRNAINGRGLGVQQQRIIDALTKDNEAHVDQGRESGYAEGGMVDNSLLPSVKFQGKQIDGTLDQHHDDILAANKIGARQKHERGFVADNKFMSREEASAYLKDQGYDGVPDSLHTQDLRKILNDSESRKAPEAPKAKPNRRKARKELLSE